MWKTIKIFLFVVYWLVSLQYIQELVNYSSDLTYYGGWLWLLLNILLTIHLIKSQNKKKHEKSNAHVSGDTSPGTNNDVMH